MAKQFDELGFKGLIDRDSCIMSGITPGIAVHYCEMSDSIAYLAGMCHYKSFQPRVSCFVIFVFLAEISPVQIYSTDCTVNK